MEPMTIALIRRRMSAAALAWSTGIVKLGETATSVTLSHRGGNHFAKIGRAGREHRQQPAASGAHCRLPTASEADPEPELHHPRLIRDVAVERRLTVIPVALVRHVGTEVLMIEQ